MLLHYFQTLTLLTASHFLLKWDFQNAGIVVSGIGLFCGLVPLLWSVWNGKSENCRLLFWFLVSLRFVFGTCTRLRLFLLGVWCLIFLIYQTRFYFAKAKIENIRTLEIAKQKISLETIKIINQAPQTKLKKNLSLEADLQKLGLTVMVLLQTTIQGIEAENKESNRQLKDILELTDNFTQILHNFRQNNHK